MSRRFAHLSDVEIFVTIIEKGSITAAAVALGTTASVLSRALTRLETRLGVQLVRRTTRQLSLTQAGRHYYEQACSAFGVFERAERDIQGRGAQTVGHIRLSAPTTYGHYRLPALLQRFAAHYPGITVELNITNRNVDLVAEGYDLAIRLGTLPDSRLVARKLEEAPLCLVAAPAYLRQHGEPHTLAALENHRCLPFIMPSSGRIAQWSLCEEGAPLSGRRRGRFRSRMTFWALSRLPSAARVSVRLTILSRARSWKTAC